MEVHIKLAIQWWFNILRLQTQH